jgi:kinesin family protein 6/9
VAWDALGWYPQVIVALSNRSREHIPYRSSKLTHILKDSIGGNCKTMMIANVWGEEAQLEETLSTCKFAQRMSRVANDPNVNLRQVSESLDCNIARGSANGTLDAAV